MRQSRIAVCRLDARREFIENALELAANAASSAHPECSWLGPMARRVLALGRRCDAPILRPAKTRPRRSPARR